MASASARSVWVILLSSHFGYSLSTTHVATGSIIGTGLGKKGAEVRWGVAGRSDADVARVRARPAERGWPLAKPDLLHHLGSRPGGGPRRG